MEPIVVDANVVFSALINKAGNPSKVFEANRRLKRFEFVAPEFLSAEIDKSVGRLSSNTGLTAEELSEAFSIITEGMRVVPLSEFSERLPEATELNFKDSPYLALAMKLGCPVLSGDKGLKKQSRVEVLSPRELLDRLLEL